MGDVAALTWPMTLPGLKPWLSEPAQNARRCLFGPVDHEALRVRLKERQKEILEENKMKWNFDFETGKPLPSGRYVWKRVGAEEEEPKDEENRGSVEEDGADKAVKKEEQTLITDFMRKRKLSNQKETTTTSLSKTRRRSST